MTDIKRKYRYGILTAALLVNSLIQPCFAQPAYDSAYASLASSRPEKLVVFTDRSLYAVNEAVRFSAILQAGKNTSPGPGSDVVYAELLDCSGDAVVEGKYLLSASRSSGEFIIPSSMPSGNYYLRCYTRWMRNFGAESFSYVPVRVVNPYAGDTETVRKGTEKRALSPVQLRLPSVQCSTDKRSYETGALVHVTFTLAAGTGTRILYGCITVAPAGSVDTSALMYRVDPGQQSSAPFRLRYLPDWKGTAISGTVVNGIGGEPSPDTRIHFSILGKDPAYLVTRSDRQGRFLIKIPARSGIQEMFVVPEQAPGVPLQVLIDNDFSSEPLPFQTESFSLSQSEKKLASRIALQMQLQQNYLSSSLADSSIAGPDRQYIPFYGKPEISVQIDEFISLPNMEEVFVNLVPSTHVMRRGGSDYFRIKSENPMISMYPPLVLIDHIPVFDMKAVLDLPPARIERIEVIPEIYVLGEIKYGGIICFKSREGDLAGIPLPVGSYFFDYASFHTPLPEPQPRYPNSSRIPDTRNTLFWTDHMDFSGEDPGEISFQAAPVPGDYLILFRGISASGEIIHGSSHILVK